MHIRKLELHGFKSFPNRTAFHFGPGISGVVGPNGCGKSNIVDAVKWCLGEQRAKSLRGQAMQDVIFAGSEGRNGMGMAEVTLHFDAGDEPFPGEWAHHGELAITRRLFKDGNSDYLINGQKVRLKDIQDLFMDSGAANRLYSFIEQGRIGEIVNARPEQRRTLIEEAAGISRYKVRRKEAEQKLEETLQNLDRVSETTGQLATRMRSLERQVAKAMRYRRLKSYIRQGEVLLSLSRYAGLTADRKGLGEQIRTAEQDEAGLIREVQRRDEALRAGREKVDALDAAVGSLRDELAELEASRREQESARQYQGKEQLDLEERRTELVQQRDEAKQSRDAASARLAGAVKDREDADRRVVAIEKDLAESRTAVRDAETVVRNRRELIEQHKNGVMERVRGLARRQAELEASTRRLGELRQRAERLASNQGAAGRDLGALDEQATVLGAEEQAAIADLDQKKAALEQAREAMTTAEQERIACQKAQREADQALHQAEREESRLRARLESLQHLQQDHAGVEDSVREALKVPGTLGTLAESLEASAELDAPLVAALGELLDAVLVPDAATAVAVQRAVKGRVRLLIADGSPAPAVGGLAARIGGTEAARAAVARLLGNCREAPDLESALARHRESGDACVVMAAEPAFVSSRGEILLGRPGTAGSAALVRKREIAELTTQVDDLTQKVHQARETRQSAHAAFDRASERVETSRSAHAQARDTARDAELVLTDLRRRRADLARERDKEQSRAQQLASELLEVRNAITETDGTLAALRQGIGQARDEQADLEKKLQEEQERLNIELGALNRARDALNARAAEAAGLRERLVGLRRSESEVQSAREAAERQAERCERELEAAAARIQELVTDDARLSASLEELGTKISDVASRLDTKKTEAREERGGLRAAEDALTKLREKREAASRHRADLDRRLVEVKTEVGRIRDDLQERYELSVSGLLDRLDRVGHVVIEVDPAARRADLPDAAAPSEKDQRMLEDLHISARMLDDNELVARWKKELDESREALSRLGEVNLVALVEYEEVAQQFNELDTQRADLEESVSGIRKTIARLNRISRERFRETFDRVDACFQEIYPRLVGGGRARLELTNEEDMLETGVDISVQPPGKRLQNLSLLSGGETAMVAIALIFSLFRVKPSPFCLLDEVDAPLDEGNGARFNVMLSEMARLSQFIVVTHNKKTMEAADTLYGVTMDTPGVSRLVSVQLD